MLRMTTHSAHTHVAVWPRAAMYGAVSRRTSTQHTADAKIICYRNLLQHAAQIELLFGMLHPSTYDDTLLRYPHYLKKLANVQKWVPYSQWYLVLGLVGLVGLGLPLL